MTHKHQPIARAEARALAVHESLAIVFRECGCFRLAGSERWTRPLNPELTRAEAAKVFCVSLRTTTRNAKLLHGKRVAGYRVACSDDAKNVWGRRNFADPGLGIGWS
jgi:hypothetical protein